MSTKNTKKKTNTKTKNKTGEGSTLSVKKRNSAGSASGKNDRSEGTGKRKYSKTGIALVGCMLVCLILCLAVGMPDGFSGFGSSGKDLDDENTPGISEVLDGESPLLIFDKRESTRILMSAFNEDRVEKVTVMYDNGEGEASSTEQSDITAVYKALKNITVIGESEDDSDSDLNSVTFVTTDGDESEFIFNGDSIFTDDTGNYEISGGGELLRIIRNMK